jgi:putative oxidoreductase
VARVALAVVVFPHGAQKAFGWFGGAGLPATVAAMGEQGLPPPVTLLVVGAETLGPVALLLGLAGRVAAAGVMAVMLGAAAVHVPHGFFMNWSGARAGEGVEYHLLAIALAAVVVIAGSGALSVDRALQGLAEPPSPEFDHVGLSAPDADTPLREPARPAERGRPLSTTERDGGKP